VHRFGPSSEQKRSWQAPSEVGFLAPLENGHFIAGAKTGLYDFDPGSSDFTLIRAVEPDRPSNRLNDGAVDSSGRLWFGSMDDGQSLPSGMLYRYYRGSLAPMDSGYVITNGPAFSPDGGILYHTDTLEKRIYAFDLREDGSLANKRIFVTIEEGAGYPTVRRWTVKAVCGPVFSAAGRRGVTRPRAGCWKAWLSQSPMSPSWLWRPGPDHGLRHHRA